MAVVVYRWVKIDVKFELIIQYEGIREGINICIRILKCWVIGIGIFFEWWVIG